MFLFISMSYCALFAMYINILLIIIRFYGVFQGTKKGMQLYRGKQDALNTLTAISVATLPLIKNKSFKANAGYAAVLIVMDQVSLSACII